jgi:HTH-type transcriptional regulator/antitoxin HigA
MADNPQPYRPISPGEILAEELEARWWSDSDFARATGLDDITVAGLLAGTMPVTQSIATAITRAFAGQNAATWVKLQELYDRDRTR